MKTVLGVAAALMLTISFTGCCGMHHGCGQNQCCDPCGGGFGGGCQPACDPCAGGYGGGGGVYGGGGGVYGGGGWQGHGHGQGCCPQQNCCHEWDDDWCEDRCDNRCGRQHRCCLLDFLSIFHMGCGAGCFGGGAACCAPYGYTDPCCNPCGPGFGAGPGQGQYAPYMMPTQPIQTLPGAVPGQP